MTRRRQRGLGLLEFAVVAALFGVLALTLLERLTELEQDGERLEVELTVRNMRVGLQLAIGEKLMRGEEDRLAELLGMNPVSFLGRLPQGYVEEVGAGGTVPGAWRYDEKSRVLAYRPRQPEAFGGRDELRWKMRSVGLLNGRVVGLRLAELPG